MKVEIEKLTVATVEAELPALCPACGAGLSEEGQLVEQQLIISEQWGELTEDGPVCGDLYRNHHEPSYVTGYRCDCGHVLVTTEG